MRKCILLVAALLCGFQLALAVPARPGKYTLTQPDGTKIIVSRHGDEWNHFPVDAFGRMLRRDADGFFRSIPEAEASRMLEKAGARRMQRRAAQAARAQEHIASGRKHFPVILVEFDDVPFSQVDPNLAFTRLLNEEGYSEYGGTGSARDYFYDNSHGLFEPVFDVFGPFKLSGNKKYYGANDDDGNDKHPVQALVEGCRGLDGQIDFSQYDADGDGVVDLVFMYYAGYGEADSSDPDTIWPHQRELHRTGTSLTLDGVSIDAYACTNELNGVGAYQDLLCGIGTTCHEFSHALGLPDFYDTDYNRFNGFAAGLFNYSLMGGGCHNNDDRTPPYFNVEERILLGWLDRDDALLDIERTGPVTLTPVRDGIARRTLTDTEGEYFLYECRDLSGWDRYIPAPGLIVYHVDRSSRTVHILGGEYPASTLWNYWRVTNSINENGSHPCFYVVPAADPDNLRFGYQRVDGNYVFLDEYAPRIPFPGSLNVTEFTARSWNGVESPVHLTDIAYADGRVTFLARVPKAGLNFCAIAGAGTYRPGDRFPFGLVLPEEGEAPASVVWYFDDEPAGADSVTLTAGRHTVDARLTYSNGRQEVVTLEIKAE